MSDAGFHLLAARLAEVTSRVDKLIALMEQMNAAEDYWHRQTQQRLVEVIGAIHDTSEC